MILGRKREIDTQPSYGINLRTLATISMSTTIAHTPSSLNDSWQEIQMRLSLRKVCTATT